MSGIAVKLDERLKEWDQETAEEVERLVGEIISTADADGLDLVRSRAVEQEVQDVLDEA